MLGLCIFTAKGPGFQSLVGNEDSVSHMALSKQLKQKKNGSWFNVRVAWTIKGPGVDRVPLTFPVQWAPHGHFSKHSSATLVFKPSVLLGDA